MVKALMNIEEQISFLSYFAQERNNSNRLGVAKGKFAVPDDIDFCNDEIVEMFETNSTQENPKL